MVVLGLSGVEDGLRIYSSFDCDLLEVEPPSALLFADDPIVFIYEPVCEDDPLVAWLGYVVSDAAASASASCYR